MLRVVFAGNAFFSTEILKALFFAPTIDLLWVYTAPDKPTGRGQKLKPSKVKVFAEDHGIRFYQPEKIDDQEVLRLEQAGVDVFVVASFGQILSTKVINAARYGCINVHTSLLPKWRGASPIVSAILAGEEVSGVSIMQMVYQLDAGDVLKKSELSIKGLTAKTVETQMAQLGSKDLLTVLSDLSFYQEGAQKQNEKLATFCGKFQKKQAQVDWLVKPALIVLHVLAFSDQPGAFSFIKGIRVKILHAYTTSGLKEQDAYAGQVISIDKTGMHVCCSDGALITIDSMQLPGQKVFQFDGVKIVPKAIMVLKGEVFYGTDQ